MLPLLPLIAKAEESTILDMLTSPWGIVSMAVIALGFFFQGFFRELGKKALEHFIKPKPEEPDVEKLWPEPLPAKSLTNITIVSRGDDFVGRTEAMKELHRRLGKQGKSSAVVGKDKLDAVHGAGGIGKTQLAVEYAAHYHWAYQARLMVIAESPQKLDEELAELVETLVPEAPAEEKQNQAAARNRVLQWFQDNDQWLLILDNIDTPEARTAVQALLPQLGRGRVLATSRLDDLGDAFELMPIDLLSPKDSADFLLKRTAEKRTPAKDDAAQAAELAQRLDGLPLSLEQAAAQINEQRLSLAQYLHKWDTAKGDEMLWFEPANPSFREPAAVTWQVSIDAAGPDAAALLRVLAWFAPEPIPCFLIDRLEQYNQSLEEPTEPAKGETVADEEADEPLLENIGDVRAALGRLCAFSLAKFTEDNEAFTVHRVLMAVTRTQMTPEQRDETLSQALRWLNLAMPQDTYDVRTWPVVTPLLPHATQACEHNISPLEPAATARLLSCLGMYHEARAAYILAESLYQRAIQIGEATLGREHFDVAIDYNNLAELLRETRRYEEAEPLYRRAINIAETTLGKDHPDVAVWYNNLALLLKQTERIAEAEPLYRRVIEIFEANEPETQRSYAGTLNNLAQLLKQTGRPAEAKPLFRRAIDIGEVTLGKDHPDVAVWYNNLASLLYESGQTREALPLVEQALAIFEAKLPAGHPSTENTRKGLELCRKALEQGE